MRSIKTVQHIGEVIGCSSHSIDPSQQTASSLPEHGQARGDHTIAVGGKTPRKFDGVTQDLAAKHLLPADRQDIAVG